MRKEKGSVEPNSLMIVIDRYDGVVVRYQGPKKLADVFLSAITGVKCSGNRVEFDFNDQGYLFAFHSDLLSRGLTIGSVFHANCFPEIPSAEFLLEKKQKARKNESTQHKTV